ncbi:GTPase domain-containing protein [Staphylococcus sp. NWU MK-U1]|nr:GTPase domain-containing protein [Staphylococcus sp. NWU MK-U1]
MVKIDDWFFGETNAGKSTIVETLIKGNGNSIGDGTKDFTKETTEKNYNDFKILDLPGMEGEENTYEDEIKKGLNKCHIIFYVSSSQKEPEEGTLNKIKRFLDKQTNIYSIMNVKKFLNSRNINQPLITEDIKTVQLRTEEKFKRTFGSHYKGSVVLSAYMAQISRNIIPKKQDAKRKSKSIELIGSEKNLYEYSNFNQFVDILNSISDKKKINNEIAISNTYKYIALNEDIVSNILVSKKDLDKQFKKINENFEETKLSISSEIDNSMKKIKKNTNVEITKLKAKLFKLVEDAHINKWDHDKLNDEVKIISKNYEKMLQKIYESELSELNTRINEYYTQMNEQIKINSKFGDFTDGFVDTEELLKKISFDIKEITKLILNVLGTIVSTLNAIPLMVVGIVSTLGSKLFKWSKVDKYNRQNTNNRNAQHKIDNNINEVYEDINRKLYVKQKELNQQIEKQNKILDKNIKKIRQLSFNMTNQIQYLNKLKVKISQNLINLIEEKEVEFAYISFGLKSLFVIGDAYIDKKIYKLKFIESHKSVDEFFTKYNRNIRNEVLYLKYNQEFQKRAITEFINYIRLKYDNDKIKKVQKEFR